MAAAIIWAMRATVRSWPLEMLKISPDRLGPLQCKHERSCNIVDVNEIPPLFAVFIDQRRLTIREARRENGENAGVGILQCLTGTVGVEQPKSDALHAIG